VIPRPLIMGIVNATPDSFSDGGRNPAEAAVHGLKLLEDGADILDIGGESTRPGACEVSADEELDRVMPVVERILRERPDCRISVDTRKALVAEAVLKAGAGIINDVSGLEFDPAMAGTVAKFPQAVVVLGHTRGTPEEMTGRCQYSNVVKEVMRELACMAEEAVKAGIHHENLWFDPGIGFAKTADQSWELLRHTRELAGLGPLVIGHSRKSFLGGAMADRDAATAALDFVLRYAGVSVLRVHDVRGALAAFRAAENWTAKEGCGRDK